MAVHSYSSNDTESPSPLLPHVSVNVLVAAGQLVVIVVSNMY